MSSLRVAASSLSLFILLACSDDPATTCEATTASATIAADSAVTCAVSGQTLTITAAIASCRGARERCKHFPNEKAGAITFNVEGTVCKTEGETTSAGCGDPTELSCTGTLPAPGTYTLAREGFPLPGTVVAEAVVIGADGSCVVK